MVQKRKELNRAILIVAAAIGVIDPNCTIKDICTSGYTATVRPPSSFTNKLKRLQMDALDLKGDPSQYEEDHRIPLELCGAPRDPDNLIPELWNKARKKDVMETRFHKAVCAGKMDLKDAQKQIVDYE